MFNNNRKLLNRIGNLEFEVERLKIVRWEFASTLTRLMQFLQVEEVRQPDIIMKSTKEK